MSTLSANGSQGRPIPNGQVSFKVVYVCMIVILGFLINVGWLILHIHYWIRKRKFTGCMQYFLAICITDICATITLLFTWMEKFVSVAHVWGFCQIMTFFGYATSALCPWLIAELTWERFVVVKDPLCRFRSRISPRRSQILICTTVFFALVYNCWFLFTAESAEVQPGFWVCGVQNAFLAAARIVNLINLIVILMIPILILLTLNCWIAYLLVHRKLKFGASAQTVVKGRAGSTKSPNKSPTKVRDSSATIQKNHNAAKKLVFVSLLYLAFNIPMHIVRLLGFFAPHALQWFPEFSQGAYLVYASQYCFHLWSYSKAMPSKFLMLRSIRKSADSLCESVMRRARGKRGAREIDTGNSILDSRQSLAASAHPSPPLKARGEPTIFLFANGEDCCSQANQLVSSCSSQLTARTSLADAEDGIRPALPATK